MPHLPNFTSQFLTQDLTYLLHILQPRYLILLNNTV